MSKYIIRRTIQAIPLLLIISIITFGLITLAPGDPTARYKTEDGDMNDLTAIREMLGVDQPIYVQYYKWLKLVLQGNLGTSFEDGRPVLEKILERMPATLILMFTAITISFIIAIPIGVYSAVKQYSKFDYFFTGLSFFGLSVPAFYFALMTILLLSLYPLLWFGIDIFPPSGMTSDTGEVPYVLDVLHHLILPASVLAFGLIASKSRYMRSSMLEVIKQDYIRTARAKGLSEKKVIFKHALRNALLPIITILGFQIPLLFGGALFIEQVFAWPGMGRLAINAIYVRDYQVIMGVTMISSVLVVLGNLIADILYAIVDPRIQYSKN